MKPEHCTHQHHFRGWEHGGSVGKSVSDCSDTVIAFIRRTQFSLIHSNTLISNPLVLTDVTSESLQSRSTQLHIRDTLKCHRLWSHLKSVSSYDKDYSIIIICKICFSWVDDSYFRIIYILLTRENSCWRRFLFVSVINEKA